MTLRILAALVWPRGRAFALLAATALAVSFIVPGAQVQTPAPAPGTPAAAAPAAN